MVKTGVIFHHPLFFVFFSYGTPTGFGAVQNIKIFNRSIMTAPGLHLLKGIFYGFLQRKGEEFRENLYLESQTTSLKWNHPIETSIGKWLALGFQVYIQKRSTFFFIRFTFEVTNPPWFASGNEISAYFTGIVLRHYKDPVMNQDLMEWHCIFSTVLWWAVFF